MRRDLSAARWFGLDWKTAKAIDYRYLERTLGPSNLDRVRLLAMDEFAIHKAIAIYLLKDELKQW